MTERSLVEERLQGFHYLGFFLGSCNVSWKLVVGERVEVFQYSGLFSKLLHWLRVIHGNLLLKRGFKRSITRAFFWALALLHLIHETWLLESGFKRSITMARPFSLFLHLHNGSWLLKRGFKCSITQAFFAGLMQHALLASWNMVVEERRQAFLYY